MNPDKLAFNLKIFDLNLNNFFYEKNKQTIHGKSSIDVNIVRDEINRNISIESKTSNVRIKDIELGELKMNLSGNTDFNSYAIDINLSNDETNLEGSGSIIAINEKPNIDLDLNLKYAQQQGKMGNHKQTISTLERLNMLYPDNVEIKLYLLSVLVQADSPNKALTIIEEIKSSEDITPEDLETVNEIEDDVKKRLAPKLWNYYADISIGGTQNNNVNSVTKNRLQDSSDSVKIGRAHV